MKKLIIFIFTNICLSTIFAQLPVVEFDDVVPRWYFIVKDTNFKSNNPAINEFNAFNPRFRPVVEEEYSYSIFGGIDDAHKRDGSALYKINNENGEIVWSSFMNVANQDFQYHFNVFDKFSDDKIVFAGRKRTNLLSDQYNDEWINFGFSQPFVRIIDSNTGHVIEDYYDKQDSIGTYGFLYQTVFRLLQNGQVVKQFEPKNDGFEIYDFNFDTKKVDYSQHIPFDVFPPYEALERSRKYFQILNEKTLVLIDYNQSKDTTLYPHLGRIAYFEMKEDTFTFVKSIDISQYHKTLASPTYDFPGFISAPNGDFVYFRPFAKKGSAFEGIWLLRLDKHGNVITYIEDIMLDGQQNKYINMRPFYIDDYALYCIALYPQNNKNGVDLIRIGVDGNVELIGSITTGFGDSRLQQVNMSMNSKGDIVMIHTWDRQYTVVTGFHISDFDFNISTENEYFTPTISLLTLKPNPATDKISLILNEQQYKNGTLYIYNMNGMQLEKIDITDTDNNIIDVTHLLPGSYIIQFNPMSKPNYFLTSKFIKI